MCDFSTSFVLCIWIYGNKNYDDDDDDLRIGQVYETHAQSGIQTSCACVCGLPRVVYDNCACNEIGLKCFGVHIRSGKSDLVQVMTPDPLAEAVTACCMKVLYNNWQIVLCNKKFWKEVI
jgi:hypothetical protein